jgi:hypothetical protein
MTWMGMWVDYLWGCAAIITLRIQTAVFVALLLVLSGCNLVGRPGNDPPAAEIVRRSIESISSATSVHFKLTALNGAMPLAPGFSATSIEGDAASPDRMQALVKARFGTVPVELRVVALGGRQFLTNPLTNQWQDVSGQLVVPSLLGRDRGIGALLSQIQRPELIGREQLGGVETFRVKGTLMAAPLADLVGGMLAAEGAVPIEIWVGAPDFRPRQMAVTGAILRDEPAELERRLELSGYDRAVSIEAPL